MTNISQCDHYFKSQSDIEFFYQEKLSQPYAQKNNRFPALSDFSLN